MRRVRTPMREIRDVDLGPRPANLFAPLSGGAMYADIGGELVQGQSGNADQERARYAAWQRAYRERQRGAA